jgi:hypothetical protein
MFKLQAQYLALNGIDDPQEVLLEGLVGPDKGNSRC